MAYLNRRKKIGQISVALFSTETLRLILCCKSVNLIGLFARNNVSVFSAKYYLCYKIFQVRERLVPDQKRGHRMLMFSSAGHNMTTY